MTGRSADPTMGQIFERMLERDQQLAAKVSDQSTVLQSIQVEMTRLGKLADKQDGYNERQITLAEKTAEHAATFDRAFKQMELQKLEWSSGLDRFGQRLEVFAETVIGHRSGLNVLRWLLGVVIVIGGALIGVIYTAENEKIADFRLEAAQANARLETKHDRDMAQTAISRDDLRDQIRELQTTKALK